MRSELTILLLAFLAAASASAEVGLGFQGAYYVPNLEGYARRDFAEPDYRPLEGDEAQRDLGSVWGAVQAKASLSVSRRFPFLVGEGPLFSGNAAEAAFALEVSPLSANVEATLSFEPLAFLVVESGAAAGTGWNAGPLVGLGVNRAGSPEELPFGGAVWRTWLSLGLKFDAAAIVPGKWNHVVSSARVEMSYEAFSGASDGQAWIWETDADHFNGGRARLVAALGYRPPSALDFIGVLAESSEWIGKVRRYSAMDEEGGWGSDYRFWRVGPAVAFPFGRNATLMVTAQFARNPDWSDATTRRLDFRQRDYEGSYWSFQRLAFSYSRILSRWVGRRALFRLSVADIRHMEVSLEPCVHRLRNVAENSPPAKTLSGNSRESPISSLRITTAAARTDTARMRISAWSS